MIGKIRKMQIKRIQRKIGLIKILGKKRMRKIYVLPNRKSIKMKMADMKTSLQVIRKNIQIARKAENNF